MGGGCDLLRDAKAGPLTAVVRGPACVDALDRCHRSGGNCDNCGHHSNSLVNAYDLSGIPGRVCYSCNRDRYALSFA